MNNASLEYNVDAFIQSEQKQSEHGGMVGSIAYHTLNISLWVNKVTMCALWQDRKRELG